MDSAERLSQNDDAGRKAAPEGHQARIPPDAERTIEREEVRGVPRADHNLEENSGEESPRAHE